MRYLLFTCLLTLSNLSFSQSPSYQPMLEPGKTWDVFSGEAGWIVPYKYGFRYFTNGVHSYLGQEYHSVWSKLFSPTNTPVFVPPFGLGSAVPFGVIREDTVSRKVYFRRAEFDWSLGEERLIYDFSLLVGDSIQMDSHIWYVLDSISITTLENSELRRKFYFHPTDAAFSPTFYIEGIGGKNGFSSPLIEYFESYDALVCVKRNGETQYSAGVYDHPCDYIAAVPGIDAAKINVFPNPVSEVLQLETTPGLFEQIRLYDVNRKLLGTWLLPPGDGTWRLPVQEIPDGPFWGILIGENNVVYFKGLKIQ